MALSGGWAGTIGVSVVPWGISGGRWGSPTLASSLSSWRWSPDPLRSAPSPSGRSSTAGRRPQRPPNLRGGRGLERAGSCPAPILGPAQALRCAPAEPPAAIRHFQHAHPRPSRHGEFICVAALIGLGSAELRPCGVGIWGSLRGAGGQGPDLSHLPWSHHFQAPPDDGGHSNPLVLPLSLGTKYTVSTSSTRLAVPCGSALPHAAQW